MYGDNWFAILTFDDHFHCADAPNVVCVSHIYPFAYLDFINFLLELPLVEFTFLSFLAYFDVGLLTLLDELGYNIVDRKAWL